MAALEKEAVVSVADLAISISDPAVVLAGKRLRWSPRTFLRRLEAAIPSVVEQYIYLEMAADYRLHPESFAKLIREFLGSQELRPCDMDDIQIGENRHVNKFTETAEFINEALHLTHNTARKELGISISYAKAARLIMLYGPAAEEILESIVSNLDELKDRMGIHRNKNDDVVIAAIINTIISAASDGRRPQAFSALELDL